MPCIYIYFPYIFNEECPKESDLNSKWLNWWLISSVQIFIVETYNNKNLPVYYNNKRDAQLFVNRIKDSLQQGTNLYFAKTKKINSKVKMMGKIYLFSVYITKCRLAHWCF